MSGLSMDWNSSGLPAIGDILNGEVVTSPAAGRFAAAVQIVRVEPERHLVAGRFVGLSGAAIDRLLDWLVRLDRAAAGRQGAGAR